MSYPLSLKQQGKQLRSLKQTQRLIMSQKMQQAIRLLQAPVNELSTLIDREIEENPLLEYSEEGAEGDSELERLEEAGIEEPGERDLEPEDALSISDDDFEILKRLDEEFSEHFSESENFCMQRIGEAQKLKSFAENSVAASESLFEHLTKQAHESFSSEEEMRAAEAVIGSLDENGFLETPLQELAALHGLKKALLKKVLETIKRFDPVGIGAKNLQESLLIQLKAKKLEETLAYRIIESHYDDLLHNRIKNIASGLRCSIEEINEAVQKAISRLDLHPGFGYGAELRQEISPDIFIREEERGDLAVELNEGPQRPLRLNAFYMRLLKNPELPRETRDFLKEKILSAKWLMRALDQRGSTLSRIAHSLVEKQKKFFTEPDGKLTPLTMKQLSEELDLHESTIARAVADKYVDCGRGIVPLRSFFTNAYSTESGEEISSDTVRQILQELIDGEDKRRPLSDLSISQLLKKKGIPCARRTVAKYRSLLNIGNIHQRRKY